MIRSLSPRDARTLSFGLICVLGIVASSRLVPWWGKTVREERDAAREVRIQLLAATALVQQRQSVSDSVRVFAERLQALKARLLSAETVGAADAELAALLSDIAAEAGVQLDVVQPLGDTLRLGSFVRVSVRTQLTTDIQGVMEMLHLLEADTVLVSVKSLTLTQSDPSADDTRAEVLRGEMVLQALFQRLTAP